MLYVGNLSQLVYCLMSKEMIKKKISIEDILGFLNDKVIRVFGETSGVFIDNLADSGSVCGSTLDWVKSSNPNKQSIVENSPARVMLVDSEVMPVPSKTLIVVRNPKYCLAIIGNYFFVEKAEIGIHPTAIIDPEAIIGSNVSIGPYSVIGKASIGDYCVIDSNVRIYDGTILGHDCVIKSGSVLGGSGFGYEKDEEGNRFRFPQIGGLLVGNFVEVGSNSCIDRGALSDTVIGDYTKINNLCHIAHNNRIGQNVCITGCVNISGSNIIDDNVWIAPNASIKGWVHIGEKAVIGMGAVVIKDIPAGETWVGNPARKLEK